MNAVIELRERSIQVPSERKAAVLIVLQTLKLLDEVELELRGDPGRELIRASELRPVN
jgi:hypothetical protein